MSHEAVDEAGACNIDCGVESAIKQWSVRCHSARMFTKIKHCFSSDKTHSYTPREGEGGAQDLRESFRVLGPEEQDLEILEDGETKDMENMEEFEFISPIPEERYHDVIVHLRNNFFADEPLNKSLGLCEPGEPHAELEIHSLNTLGDQLSVMAVSRDTDQIAAVSLNGVQYPGDIRLEREKLEKMTDEKFKRIFTLLSDINEKLDLFKKYHVEKLFDARILSVDSGFRGKGLGKEIIKRAQEVAEKHSFQMMKGDATGKFSQRILTSLDWELVHELKYADHVDEDGAQVFKTPAPHESLKIMVKILK